MLLQRAGFTALHFAVQCTNAAVRLQLCELLLKQGASPNAPAGNGLLTPLHWACANALADVSALLVGELVKHQKLNIVA